MAVGGRQDLVGRDHELAAVSAAIEQARAGRGAVVIVEGEAGIGKTRLLAEARQYAAALGFVCLSGAAYQLEQGRPFGAFGDALGLDRRDAGAPTDLAATVRRAGTSADARFLAQEAIVEHLENAAVDAPLFVSLDDVHWSDGGTLATIWALARRVDPLPLVVLVAARPIPRSAELDRLVADCTGIGATCVRLRSLAPDAVEALAGNVVGATPAASLLDQLAGTGGNPFFVIEMLESLLDEGVIETDDHAAEARARSLPPELRASLLRRVGAIGTDAESVLGLAAVLGGPFAIDDLGSMLGRPTGEWSDILTSAVRAGILEDHGSVLAFRHDLIREALYEHLPAAVRTGLHRDAARMLGERLEPSVRARHLVLGAADGDTTAVEGLRDAAGELAAREPDAAAVCLQRALELAHDDGVQVDIVAELVQLFLAAGRTLDAERHATDALASSDVGPETEASLRLALGEVASHQGRIASAIEHFQAAVGLGLDERTSAHARGRIAENRVWTFDLATAWAESELALDEARRIGHAPVVAEALSTQCAVRCFEASFGDAILLGEAAVSSAGNDPEALRSTPHAYLGLALMGGDRHDEARRVAEAGRRLAAGRGQMLALPNFHALLVRQAWFTGRWDDATAEANAAAELAADFGLTFGAPANDAVVGLIAFHRGDLDTPRAMQARALAAREQRGDVSGSELGVLLDALLAEADGDAESAAARLIDLMDLMAAIGMRATQLWVGPEAVRMALAAGRPEQASDLAVRIEKIAHAAGTPSAVAASTAARGLATGDADLLVGAGDAYAEARRPLDSLLATEWAGTVLAAAGRREQATSSLQSALDAAQALGAVRDERRILAALRALGVRLGAKGERRRAVVGWDSLTDAERQVALLIGERLRNTEIAERLFISRRTVETHVSRLYTKLETRSRAELTRIVQSHLATERSASG